MTAVTRVSDLAEQIRGVSYDKEDASSTPRPGYLPVLRAGNISDDGLVFDDLVFVPAARIAEKQKIRRNDILIAASSGSLDVVGKAARALDDYEGGFGAFCKVLRPRPHVDPAYLAHFFRTPEYRRTVSALAAGVNINNLRNEHLDEIRIPLPPLSEQRRLAEILDKADALRAKRRAALAQLDTLTQSIFLDLFGDPITNPKGWTTTRLGNLCTRITDGTHQPPEWSETGHPFLFVSNVISGELTFDTAKFISDETHTELMRRCPIEVGDVLYSTVGSYGVPAVVRTTRKFAFQRHIAHLKADRGVLDPEFLRAMLASPPLKRQADRVARGVAQKTVNLADIREFIVFSPPLEVQREFAGRVSTVDALKARHRASLNQLDALFASLQHRAFREKL